VGDPALSNTVIIQDGGGHHCEFFDKA